jgi:ParB-like chromosome segregation protein Spo0J
VIKGHGRLLAVQKLGWDKIPAFVLDKVDECELVKLFLMENEVRHSLTSAERALLMEQDFKKDVPVTELARRYGFRENTVYSYLAILESLSPKINSLLSKNQISLSTAKTIGKLDKDEQDSLAPVIEKEPHRANIEYMANAMREQKDKNRIKVTRGVLKRSIQGTRTSLEEKKKELQIINEEWIDVVGGIRTLLQDITFVRKLNRYNVDYSKFVRMQ